MKKHSKILAFGLVLVLLFTTACSGEKSDPFVMAMDDFIKNAKNASYVQGEELVYFKNVENLDDGKKQQVNHLQLKHLDAGKYNYTIHLTQGNALYYTKDAKETKDDSFFGELYAYDTASKKEEKLLSMQAIYNDVPAKIRQGMTKGNFALKPLVIQGKELLFYVYTDFESEGIDYLYSYNLESKKAKQLYVFEMAEGFKHNIKYTVFENKFYFTGGFAINDNEIIEQAQVQEYNFENSTLSQYTDDGYDPVVYDGKLYYKDYKKENEDWEKFLKEQEKKAEEQNSETQSDEAVMVDVTYYFKTKDGNSTFSYTDKANESVSRTVYGNTVLFESEITPEQFAKVREQNSAIPEAANSSGEDDTNQETGSKINDSTVIQTETEEEDGVVDDGEEEGVEGDVGGADDESVSNEGVIGVTYKGKFQPLMLTVDSFNASSPDSTKTDNRYVVWDKYCSVEGQADLNFYDMESEKFISVGKIDVKNSVKITTIISDSQICFVVYEGNEEGEVSGISVYNVPKNIL